jgi:hypothetical protein
VKQHTTTTRCIAVHHTAQCSTHLAQRLVLQCRQWQSHKVAHTRPHGAHQACGVKEQGEGAQYLHAWYRAMRHTSMRQR